jgi:hypothetical protein
MSVADSMALETKDDQEIRDELDRKGEITLANSVLDDMKALVHALFKLCLQIYAPYIAPEDCSPLFQDIIKLIVNAVVRDDVYKILICLIRIDNFELDKDLRAKYSLLKGIKI